MSEESSLYSSESPVHPLAAYPLAAYPLAASSLAAAPTGFIPGSLIADRYRVVKCLGKGSCGSVYLCIDRQTPGRAVALKTLSGESDYRWPSFNSFLAELTAGRRIEHPSVVRIYETVIQGDLFGFNMEYVEGGTLAGYLQQRGALPLRQAVRLMRQICQGVEALHAKGITHHDLKPANVLLTSELDAKVCDFGVSKSNTPREPGHSLSVTGTASYISPEYLSSGISTPGCDVYSLGVMAYEMITGRPPFEGKTSVEILSQRFGKTPRLVHLVRPDCPLGLSRIISKAMANDPRERFKSVCHLHRALRVYQARCEFVFSVRRALGTSKALEWARA